ncbi:MAG TPA: DUF4294 domain-containing protein [Parasegetibacter sp.]|jgi:hypothetical protein
MKKQTRIVCFSTLIWLLGSLVNGNVYAQSGRFGPNDTILVPAVIYNGDTIPSRTLEVVYIEGVMPEHVKRQVAKWTRLRNAVYVTYPYARKAGLILNEINRDLAGITNKNKRKDYLKSREKELKKEFTDPLTELSVYQGRILMKLINRQTGNNCYEIVKEYKGGVTARFYQTVAFFYSSSLKQPYDPTDGEDADIEKIVREIERMYALGIY